MKILIANGHIMDPSQGIDGIGDIIIDQGKIQAVSTKQSAVSSQKDAGSDVRDPELRTIDARGLYVFPGFIDMHAHLREPGSAYKETIRTGTLAAVRGGFTSVCAMPNTSPVNDNSSVTDFVIRKAIQEGSCTVYPIGAITKGQKGEELAEMGIMHAEGCVAFSDDGRSVMNSLIMRRALEYAKVFNVPIISHCEDMDLSEGGVMNEGLLSAALGLRGIPSESEEVMVGRDIALAALTGGRLHIAHVSTEGSVRLVREAKSRGLSVTAETCPHYFSITEEMVRGFNTAAKVNPPLRTEKDVEAIKEGLRDGTIDVIATDHAPHHRDEKALEFDQAPFGISGIETAFSLSLRLVKKGVLSLQELISKLTVNPARILSLPKGTLRPGSDADVTVVAMEKGWEVRAEEFASKGKNTPFEGWAMEGRVVHCVARGILRTVERDA